MNVKQDVSEILGRNAKSVPGVDQDDMYDVARTAFDALGLKPQDGKSIDSGVYLNRHGNPD